MDTLIRNAKIIDGNGKPAYIGDVGIDGGKLVLSELPETADRIIDAKGQVLSPGFVDCHSHGDSVLGEDFGDLCKLNQGVTTDVAGNCGSSVAPNDGPFRDKRPDKTWKTWSSYADDVDRIPMAKNTMLFIGANTLRTEVMGYTDREPTGKELEQMKSLIKDAMEHGARGLSTGLVYLPGMYSTTEEVVELVKVIAPYGGMYSTHMRNESFDLVKSVKEAVYIGETAGVDVNISHFKVLGRSNWGTVHEAIEVIEDARARGLHVTVDQYPYDHTMTQLYPAIPPWHFTEGVQKLIERLPDPALQAEIRREMNDPATDYENVYLNAGGWSGVLICSAPETPQYAGMYVDEIAEKEGKDPFDVFIDLLIRNKGAVPTCYHSIGDADIDEIIRLPYAMAGSDGIVRSRYGYCHPRGWGFMTRAITRFVKERKVLSLEELVHRNTGLASEVFGLRNKGLIREGYDADLVLFDYDHLEDRAGFRNPTALAGGISLVMVGGAAVYENGALTGSTPGKLIRYR